MLTATVTSKGQLTLPIELRRALHIKTGTQIEFVPDSQGSYRLQPKVRRAADLAGFLPKPAKTISLQQMEEGIAAGMSQSMRQEVQS